MPYLSKIKLNGIEYDLKVSGDNVVTGVKGNAEADYRHGDINLTPENIGTISTEAEQTLTDTQKLTGRTNLGLGTAATRSVPASGNANATQVVLGSDSRLSNARPASDVPAWAKAESKPSYTKSEVGLGNVGNFKAVSTVANQGLTEAEKQAARANIGAGSESQTVTVDTELSTTSENPVQNKVITTKMNTKYGTDDSASTTISDTDYVPMSDTNGTKKKTLWSTIIAKIKASLSKSDVGLGNVPNVTTNNQTPTFTEASTRANIASGETLSTLLGKIKKFFSDLKTVAFTGSYNDLSNKPTIPSKTSQLTNDSNFSTFSGSYNDLSNKPAIVTKYDLASFSGDKYVKIGTCRSLGASGKRIELHIMWAVGYHQSFTGHLQRVIDVYVEGGNKSDTTYNNSWAEYHGVSRDSQNALVYIKWLTYDSFELYMGPATYNGLGYYTVTASNGVTWEHSSTDAGTTLPEEAIRLGSDRKVRYMEDTIAYSEITGTPTIPTKTSQLTNDSGFKTTDNNTTYTFATGDSNGQIKVTPSGGSAQNINVKGLGSAAFANNYAGSDSAGGPANFVKTPRSNGNYNDDLPGTGKTKIVEHGTDSPNRPADSWFYVITSQGGDAAYATQLALGMTTGRNYVRTYQGGNWLAWNELGTVFKVSSLNANNLSHEGIWYVYGSITGAPSSSHGVLWYVNSIGTPFQMYFPDNVPTVYKRWYTNGSWSDWTDLNSTATNRGLAGNNVSWDTMGDGYYGTNPNQIPTELQSLFSSYSYFSSYGTLHLNKGSGGVYPVIEYMDVFGHGARWNSNQRKWTPFRRPTGNATAAQVLSGYTASNESSDGFSGSIPQRDPRSTFPAVSTGHNGTAGYVYIPYGYYQNNETVNGQPSTWFYLTDAQLQGMHKHTATKTPTGGELNSSAMNLGDFHGYKYVNTAVCYNAGASAKESEWLNKRAIWYSDFNSGDQVRFTYTGIVLLIRNDGVGAYTFPTIYYGIKDQVHVTSSPYNLGIYSFQATGDVSFKVNCRTSVFFITTP